jgi:hypothetical protein
MPLIQELAALLEKYRGTSEVSDETIGKIEEAMLEAIRGCRPYKVAKVEFLLPADADEEKLQEALSGLRDNCFNDPIAEWRMVSNDYALISGPDAEVRFEQKGLEYPGKLIYDDLMK